MNQEIDKLQEHSYILEKFGKVIEEVVTIKNTEEVKEDVSQNEDIPQSEENENSDDNYKNDNSVVESVYYIINF